MIEEIPSAGSRPVNPQRIELFLEGVKDYAIILIDSQGAVLSWNDGAALMFGYNPAEVIGQPFAIFHARGRPARRARPGTSQGGSLGTGNPRALADPERW